MFPLALATLSRLRQEPNDQAAWNEFLTRYEPLVLTWCRGFGLQDADARDVAQNVLLRLARKMKSFQYDPSRSFRAWLKTLTHHAWSDYQQARGRPGQGSGGSHVGRLLESIEAREDLLKRLAEEFDRELLEEAMNRARIRVAPQTWQAFHLTAIEGLSGAEAAERIPMAVAQVFIAKRRVQKAIQDELAKLDGLPES